MPSPKGDVIFDYRHNAATRDVPDSPSNRRFWPLEYGAFGWLKRSEHRRLAAVTLARAARPG
jgi:hypothetical protein